MKDYAREERRRWLSEEQISTAKCVVFAALTVGGIALLMEWGIRELVK